MGKKLLDKSLWSFLAIGLMNTFITYGLMFLMYDALSMGYWLSSSIAFAITSVLSFVLNRKLSFASKAPVRDTLWRFALVIAVCYFVAYSLAKPAVAYTLAAMGLGASTEWIEKLALLVGQVIFTGLNYFGQRFFAFKS